MAVLNHDALAIDSAIGYDAAFRKKHLMKSHCIVPFLIVGLAAPLGAELSDDDARSVAARAADLQVAGHYRQAVSLVDRELAHCGGDACWSRLTYTLAYLHERQSLREPEAAKSLLELSAASYASILDRRPNHWPTLYNLVNVYARLGDDHRVEGVLRGALDVDDAERRAALALALGDLYQRQERRDEAIDAYRGAVAALPDRTTPKRREIRATAELISSQASELLERLRSWQEENPDIARQGYQAILEKVWEVGPEAAESALLSWIDLTSRGAGSTPGDDVRRLSSDWRPIGELQAFVADPAASQFSSWWFAEPKRVDALAHFLLAVGRAQDSPQDANRVWQAGLELEPPSPLTAAWANLYTEIESLLE